RSPRTRALGDRPAARQRVRRGDSCAARRRDGAARGKDAHRAPRPDRRQQVARSVSRVAGARRPRPHRAARRRSRRRARARALRPRVLRRAALVRPAHAQRAARGGRGGGARAAHVSRARRLRRAHAHDHHGTRPVRPPEPAPHDGGAHLLPAHEDRPRHSRKAQDALPEGNRARRDRVSRAHRRGTVQGTLGVRVCAQRSRRARARRARGGARAPCTRCEWRPVMSESPLRAVAGDLAGADDGSPAFQLDRDPFLDDGLPDPLVRGLDELERRAPVRLRAVPNSPKPRLERRRRTPPARPSTGPTLSEIELGDEVGLLDRPLPERARRALASIAHLVEGESPYDRFGFSPSVAKRAMPWFHALYKYYFRVESHGHEHLPERGRAVLAANHAGLLPFDGAMSIVDILLHTDPPRLARAIVDRWAGELPFVNVFYSRVGQVIGTRENFADLLDDDQLVLVFPEGIDGIRKTITHRYRLQNFRVGFIEQALRAGAPIVPMAVIGSDDQTPILYD